MLRKLAIAAILVFLDDPHLQAFCAFLVAFLALLAHFLAQPFANPVHNLCEGVGLVTVILTQTGSLLYFYLDNAADVGSEAGHHPAAKGFSLSAFSC